MILDNLTVLHMVDNTPKVRESYDRLAEEYARHIFAELQYKPFDCALLKRFAAQLAGLGEICDMGCGPGHITRYLHEAGARVSGLDISPAMLEQARKLNPEISFREGNMLALDLPDESLAGISAFYAIVNFPEDALLVIFREMERVLKPGGRLLLSFHIGSEVIHVDELWNTSVSMDFFLFEPSRIQSCLEKAALIVEEVLIREPYAPEVEYQSRRAYIFARKPGGTTECM